MERVPIEVLANNIFKYFTFEEWLEYLIPVCTLWKKAAIISNAAKQMWLDLELTIPMRCIPLTSKYRIDTLIFHNGIVRAIELESVLNASPNLRTLVFDEIAHKDLTSATKMMEISKHVPKKTFPYVTTLSINEENFPLLAVFPNLTRLRIEEYDEDILADYKHPDVPIFPKIRELEVACDRFSNFDRIKVQFPSLETLYVTVLDYARNTEISQKGKALGIKVFNDNPHLVINTWRAPSVSYHLFTAQHGSTPLFYPLRLPKNSCTAEKFEELHSRTSKMYEGELATRSMEFRFPARTTQLIRFPLSEFNIIDPADPILLSLLWKHQYMDFWNAFERAIKLPDLAFALELSKELPNHLKDHSRDFKKILKLLEKLGDLQKFLDVVGSEGIKKIMAFTNDGENVILSALMSGTKIFNIDFGPIDQYIDWTVATKLPPGTNDKPINLATLAFSYENWPKWEMLVKEKNLKVEIERYNALRIENFIRYFREDIEILANIPEARHKVLFLAPFALRDENNNTTLKKIIAKFGSNKMKECYEGHYLLQFILQRTRNRFEILNTIPYLVEIGFDINFIDKGGKTPLALFVEIGLSRHYSKDFIEIMERLLCLGANPNLVRGDDLPPLFLVLQKPYSSAVELLLDHGANINIVIRNSTPLSIAVKYEVFVTIVKLLISRGADPKFIDESTGNTLLHEALFVNNIQNAIATISLLAKSHVDIKRKNLKGDTPLELAKTSGVSEQIIKELKKRTKKHK